MQGLGGPLAADEAGDGPGGLAPPAQVLSEPSVARSSASREMSRPPGTGRLPAMAQSSTAKLRTGVASGNGRPRQRHTWPMGDHHVVAAILRRADHVLLCHRSPGRRWYPDVWDFPGGHIQPGEDPRDALRRELAEELGVEPEGLDDEPVLRRSDPHTGLDLAVWVSRRWRGTVANLQPEEHDAIGWFGRGQLDGLSFADPSYLTLLQRLLDVS